MKKKRENEREEEGKSRRVCEKLTAHDDGRGAGKRLLGNWARSTSVGGEGERDERAQRVRVRVVFDERRRGGGVET